MAVALHSERPFNAYLSRRTNHRRPPSVGPPSPPVCWSYPSCHSAGGGLGSWFPLVSYSMLLPCHIAGGGLGSWFSIARIPGSHPWTLDPRFPGTPLHASRIPPGSSVSVWYGPYGNTNTNTNTNNTLCQNWSATLYNNNNNKRPLTPKSTPTVILILLIK